MSPARVITVRVFSELGHEGLPEELRPGDTFTVDPGTRVQVAGITVICRPCGQPTPPMPADRRATALEEPADLSWTRMADVRQDVPRAERRRARVRRLRRRLATWRHRAGD